MRGVLRMWAGVGVAAWVATAAMAAPPEESIATLKAVGPRGKGNVAASRAMRRLAEADASVLPKVLAGFEGANPLAENWLRSAFETIADRAIRSGEGLPTDRLEQFIRNRDENPRARRLAYEWLLKVDDTADDRLIPGMLHDPSPTMRRDAVARLIKQAQEKQAAGQKPQAIALYREALSGAVHDDQVKAIVGPLEKLGEKVDLQKHFGFLAKWSMIGPFDNHDKVGFAAVYPPEKKIDLKAAYEADYHGKTQKVAWEPVTTEDEYGVVDIAKALSNYKGSVMYATTRFDSPRKQVVELRLGTPNAWKIWVNGKLLFAREEYHRGMALDQYRVEATLEPGPNVILLKICQNEQTESWAQRYRFQLRVCDHTGTGLSPGEAVRTSALDRENQ